MWLPVDRSWCLNDRHYGGLTGLNKAETAAKHGEEQVKIWRRSFDIPPPPMDKDHPYNKIISEVGEAFAFLISSLKKMEESLMHRSPERL